MSKRSAEQLYHGITNVREEFIEEAQREMMQGQRRARAGKLRFFPAAACLLLVLGTITAVGAVKWGVRSSCKSLLPSTRRTRRIPTL